MMKTRCRGINFGMVQAANAEAFMLSVYQNLRTATTDNGFFLYAGDIRCAPITGLKTNNYLYLVQNNMKGYKGVKDSKDEGSSSDFGAIYNWRNMYKVVQSANIMIEEVSNVKELSSGEIERYRAESVFCVALLIFSWCVSLVMCLIIRKPIILRRFPGPISRSF